MVNGCFYWQSLVSNKVRSILVNCFVLILGLISAICPVRKDTVIKSIVLGFLLATPFYAAAQQTAPTAMVVVNSTVKVHKLSQAQLRSIYMMRQVVWPDGSAIKVFVLPNQAQLHLQFSRQQLQLFPYQLERVWQKLTFSGTGTPPTEVENSAKMRELVASTPGAIGYIETTDDTSELQIVQIQP